MHYYIYSIQKLGRVAVLGAVDNPLYLLGSLQTERVKHEALVLEHMLINRGIHF